MKFFEVVRKRRSIHHFTKEEVSDEDLGYILEAARLAPSAGNSQPWRFIIVREPKSIHKIWESTAGIELQISSKRSIRITPQNFIKEAPVIIVVCTDPTAYKGRQANLNADLFCIQDSANATMSLLLAVCDRGLGACWVGMFKEEKLRESLNIPRHIRPVAIIPVGYTTSREKTRPRKPLEELVLYESF